MINIYCRTTDALKQVGKYVCKNNSGETKNSDSSWAINESEDDCWVIETKCNSSAAGMIYRIGKEVICIEVDEDCAPKVIEPLMKKYGFDNVKWLTTK